MAYIDVDTVKDLLGITASTYDDQIEATIPVVESAARRITHNKFTTQIKGDIMASLTGEKTPVLVPLSIYSGASLVYDGCNYIDATLDDCLFPGQTLAGPGITAGAYIEEIFGFPGAVIDGVTYDTPVVIIAGTATTADDVTAVTGIPIDLKPVLAKGVWWSITQKNQTITDTAWTSKTVGPLSISREGKDAAIDGQYGFPAWFVKSFPRFHT